MGLSHFWARMLHIRWGFFQNCRCFFFQNCRCRSGFQIYIREEKEEEKEEEQEGAQQRLLPSPAPVSGTWLLADGGVVECAPGEPRLAAVALAWRRFGGEAWGVERAGGAAAEAGGEALVRKTYSAPAAGSAGLRENRAIVPALRYNANAGRMMRFL
jgi:hypothetical protein